MNIAPVVPFDGLQPGHGIRLRGARGEYIADDDRPVEGIESLAGGERARDEVRRLHRERAKRPPRPVQRAADRCARGGWHDEALQH